LAIYDAPLQKTAQVMGTVTKVNNDEMMQKALRIMSRHSKEATGKEETPIPKLNAGNNVLYMLTPQFIRLADYKYGANNQIFEVATPVEESLEN
jgi:hypothetical protein